MKIQLIIPLWAKKPISDNIQIYDWREQRFDIKHLALMRPLKQFTRNYSILSPFKYNSNHESGISESFFNPPTEGEYPQFNNISNPQCN